MAASSEPYANLSSQISRMSWVSEKHFGSLIIRLMRADSGERVYLQVEYGGAETGFMREVFRTVIVPFLPKSEYAWPESVESEKWTVLAYPLTIPNARVTGSSSKSRTKEHRKGFPLFFALPVSAELTPAVRFFPRSAFRHFSTQ